MKLKFKLSILVIAIMAVIVSGISILLLNRSSSMARQLTIGDISELANTRATYWEGVEDRRFAVLETLANIMAQYETVPLEERRDEYENLLLGTINANPDIVTMYTIWKPNAVDGMDAAYIGRVGSTPTGQYAITYTRENNTLESRATTDLDASMAYINGPNSRRARVEVPFARTLQGRDTY
ncbi:MAG: hypothetical protein LBQ94_07775, partial [Treponema sp.]|nr:hypothetical protein [Treponema sp.]